MTFDGRLVSGFDNSLKIWDLLTGECQRTLKGHSDMSMYCCYYIIIGVAK